MRCATIPLDMEIDRAAEDIGLADLLAAVAGGDRDAMSALYEQTSASLFGTLRHLLRSEETAEDVLHDVYVSIWLRAGSFDATRGRALTWMRSIARNRAIDVLRRRRDEQPLSPGGEAEGVYTELPTSTGDENKLARCLGKLSREQQMSVRLAYQQGMSHSEISTQMGVPLGTAKSWVRRALDALRRCMSR